MPASALPTLCDAKSASQRVGHPHCFLFGNQNSTLHQAASFPGEAILDLLKQSGRAGHPPRVAHPICFGSVYLGHPPPSKTMGHLPCSIVAQTRSGLRQVVTKVTDMAGVGF